MQKPAPNAQARARKERKKQLAPKGSGGPDQAIVDAIRKNLELGMSLASAARAARVPKDTAYSWAEKYEWFAQEVDFSNADGEKNLLVRALAGGKGSAQSTWVLERRFREDYGAVTKIETTNLDDRSNMTREEKEAELARILALRESKNDASDPI